MLQDNKKVWHDRFSSVLKYPDATAHENNAITIGCGFSYITNLDKLKAYSDATKAAALNELFSEAEVASATKRIKCIRSAGIDGIWAEMLKIACDKLLSFIVATFDSLFLKQSYAKD